MTATPRFIGVQPWFPGALGRWKWLTDPIPAERVAALRIAAGVTLLLDIVVGYLPYFTALFSPDVFGGRDLYAWRFREGHHYWSILRLLPDGWGPVALMMAWMGSAVGLVLGWRPLLCGLVAWACAVSVWNISPGLHNGGDRLRNTLFLMVAVSCSGAVWGVSSVRRKGERQPVVVPGWPVKVLLVQLAALYFFAGLYKVISVQWQSGYAMYYVAHDLAWSNTAALTAGAPLWVHQLTAWGTLVWELGFPVLVVMKGTRAATLVTGVVFHLISFVTLEVGMFALYAVACYAAFVPWERLKFGSRRPRRWESFDRLIATRDGS